MALVILHLCTVYLKRNYPQRMVRLAWSLSTLIAVGSPGYWAEVFLSLMLSPFNKRHDGLDLDPSVCKAGTLAQSIHISHSVLQIRVVVERQELPAKRCPLHQSAQQNFGPHCAISRV